MFSHSKMMLLLLLCLLLPATTALSKELEGSADDSDDEDLVRNVDIKNSFTEYDPDMDKATGVSEPSDQFVGIVVGVGVAVVALSVAVIVAILLVRHNMQRRQQGVYSVPAEQGQKGSV
ncbi:unnamed protein product [Lota lota]